MWRRTKIHFGIIAKSPGDWPIYFNKNVKITFVSALHFDYTHVSRSSEVYSPSTIKRMSVYTLIAIEYTRWALWNAIASNNSHTHTSVIHTNRLFGLKLRSIYVNLWFALIWCFTQTLTQTIYPANHLATN